ncbi:MAG: NAD(P)/FAD-dependent oxidoreductase [Actinobacteria bacterium]|nr:NAD(P)/FAD-dependent oxidoreductase [Actinomycetota bacterium]
MDDPSHEQQRYDVAVVGAGPAGVSAAINVANRGRSVVLLAGQAPFGRVNGPHEIANYAGFAVTSGDALVAAFRRHLDVFDVPVLREKVTRIGRDGDGSDDDGFILFGSAEAYPARTVVLATGVIVEAAIEGEDKLVGQGVSYCVTCDGRLFSGRQVAVVGYGTPGEEEASELAESFGAGVTYLPQYEGEYRLAPAVDLRTGLRPSRLTRTDAGVRVTLVDARGAAAEEHGTAEGGAGPADVMDAVGESACVVDEFDVAAVFISREAVAPETLLDGLAVDGPHLVVDRSLRTSVPGVFAAGDCTGGPYQVAKAVGEGQVAALSAVRLLREREEAAT